MKSSDLERVERAIRAHIKCDTTGLSPAVASVFLIGFEEAARAAVVALMEPSEEAIQLGREGTDDGRSQIGTWEAKRCFQAMLRAVLGEPKP